MKTRIHPESYVPKSPSEFIGPAHELATILKGKAARLAKEGGNAKLLLYGPPGVGKSRLALLFAANLTSHPVQVEIVNGRSVSVWLVDKWLDDARSLAAFGEWTVKIIDELDTCPPAAQDLLLTYLDRMAPQTAFIGTSNLDLNSLVERFHTRLQQFKVGCPDTEVINSFLTKWKLRRDDINRISVGCGGNVRAALLDAQSFMDKEAV
jgi:replication-associated recombination protein RarA